METLVSKGKITDVKVFDNVFSEEDFLSVYRHLCFSSKWSFGSHSQRPDIGEDNQQVIRLNAYSGIRSHHDPFVTPFWRMELSEEKFFNTYLFDKVKELTGDDFDIEMIYANGQTYGQSGSFHQDHHEGHTFLLYSNSHWDVEWGGNTVFMDEDNVLKYIPPIPNRAVYFPGTILHYAESPTRRYSGLRMTVAFKLFKKKS